MGLEHSLQQHLQSMGSINAMAVRKYLSEILKDRYVKNQDIVERIVSVVITQRDLQEFGRLIADIYEVGFLKAVDDYRHVLGDMGREVKITSMKSPPEGKLLFSPKNQGRRSKE